MTLEALLADCYRKAGFPVVPDTTVTTRLTAFLNETVQEILAEPGMTRLADLAAPVTFASVASTPTATLPPNVARVLAITDRTNDARLESRDLQWYRSVEPDPTANTGTPEVWVPMGLVQVAVQPSDASELFAKSTSASDVNPLYIEGYRTGGYFKALNVAMTGTTAVSLSASFADFLEVTKCYLAAPAVGTVTLHEDSGVGTTLATIPIGQTFARYHQIALWPTPAAAVTYYVDAERDLPDMVNPTDEPVLPVRFHRVLVEGALMKEWQKKDDSRYRDAASRFVRGVGQLKAWLWYPPDEVPVKSGEGPSVRFSRLGAWAPADWVK